MHSKPGSTPRPLVWWCLPVILVVLLIYVWFISAGEWTTWPPSAIYNYYSHLATAFQGGHLYLDDQPSPELLALPDPYRIGARKTVPYIWDASLFQGRYYLYWGPTPAVLLLPVQLILRGGQIGDLYLVFAFICGLYAVLCALALRIWRRSFQELPPWTLGFGLLLLGLLPPLTWMLNRPEVYEAALAAGQFFLLGGLYWLLSAFDRDRPSTIRLLLASAFWALAVGSRTNQALPVLFLVVLTLIWLIVRDRADPLSGRKMLPLVALLLPLLLGAALLAWYNWARFGSPFEFGYRYQLTLLQLPKHYDQIFSWAYVIPNLLNYFLNPFTTSGVFPFIKPQYGLADFRLPYPVPRIYFSEAVTGLVYTFPFLIFAAIAVLAAFRSLGARSASEHPSPPDRGSLPWTLRALVGILLIQLATLLAFFFATERYLAELTPTLGLLSVIGLWAALQRLTSARWRTPVALLASILALATIVVSGLLAISSYQERFLTTNPALMNQLVSLFAH